MVETKGGNTNTNHTGEAYLPLGPASMESLLCINDEITCLLWESKVCFAWLNGDNVHRVMEKNKKQKRKKRGKQFVYWQPE